MTDKTLYVCLRALGMSPYDFEHPPSLSKAIRRIKWTGIQYVVNRKLQPFTVWRQGTIIHFCKTESEADDILIRSKPATIKVPIPLPVPLPLHGDNGGSHHRRLPGEKLA